MTAAPIRLGLVGAGAIAQTAHLPVLARARGVELVALCDNDGAKARALADRFGARDVFTDIDDLLELDTLDAVIVATPNHLHEPHVLAAIRRGVDVLCERPLSLTARGIERILAAAARTGRRVVVGNNHRFRNDVQQLRRFVSGGELGAVTGVRAGHFQIEPMRDGWRARRAEAGGGAFLDLGYALVDQALWITGFPEAVRVTATATVAAAATRGRGSAPVEDALVAQIELAGGATLAVDVAWNHVGTEERLWFEVLATRGSARLAPLRVVKALNGRPVDVSPAGAAARESIFLQSYRAELAHFAAVAAGDAPYEPPADQLAVQRVVDAVYRSADDGREVRL